MLENILLNYSEGELIHLIGEENVNSYQKLKNVTIDKMVLVSAIKTLFGFDILQNPEKRKRLIERMSEAQVTFVLEKTWDKLNQKDAIPSNTDKYASLEILANTNPHAFISSLGYKSDLNQATDNSSTLKAISHCRPEYPLYPYQLDISKKVNSLINSSDKNKCLIHLPTGAGKTRTAMNIIADHLRKNPKTLVLWLADTSELCTQAVEEFHKAWTALGNTELKVYSYFSDSNISLGGINEGLLVAGLHKLNSSRKQDISVLYNMIKDCVSLIVFDEAHKAIAPTYAQIIQDMLPSSDSKDAFLLGLSATPGRKLEADSDEDAALTQFFDSTKVTMKVKGYSSPINYLVENKYLAQARFHNIDYEGGKLFLDSEFSGNELNSKIRAVLSEDDNRNLKLLDTIKAEYDKGSSIIVFSCSVEHSQAITSLLAFDGIKAYSLDSKNDNASTRRYKISEYHKGNVRIIINYNILTAGFDAPKTNVAIIARPTNSLVQYSQMVGRAMRGPASKGNSHCDIYTVRDDIPAFRSVLEAFSHWDELWQEA